MSTDAVSQLLRRHLDRCRAPRRHTTITTRWAHTHTALAGLSIDDIVDCCQRGTVEQNPIIAALLELHQSGDADASTVLLSVCTPIIHGIAHHAAKTANRSNNAGADNTRTRSGTDNLWAALGHALATINPATTPTDNDGNTKVFLAFIGSTIFESRKRIDASDRRRHRYSQRHGEDGHARLISLTDTIVDQEHRRRFRIDISAVEDAALRSIELDRIADVVRGGIIGTDQWCHLVNHRVGHTTTATTRDRVAAHRTARQLARLVDHAA